MRKLLTNAGSLLATDAVNRVSSFILYALIARRLGTFEFGQFSLAFSLYATFQVFAGSGLRWLVTRDIAKDRGRTDAVLVNGSLVALACSCVSVIALTFLVLALRYSSATRTIVLLLSLSLIPWALSAVVESVFRAWERMHYIVYANVPANLLKIGLAVFVLSHRGQLLGVCAAVLISSLALVGLEWYVMWTRIVRPGPIFRLRYIDLSFAWSLIKSASTFIGMEGFVGILGSINIVMLSKMAGEREVGLYNAATQITVPLVVLYQSIIMSVFPGMCRGAERTGNLPLIAERVLEMLLVLIVPSVIGLLFLARPVMLLLYRNHDFSAATLAVRVIALSLFLAPGTAVFGYVLVAGVRERVNLEIAIADVVVNLVLGFVLIPRFGINGAALTLLLTRAIDYLQHYIRVSSLIPRLQVFSIAWKALGAGLCMAGYLLLARHEFMPLQVASAATLYAAIWLALAAWSLGGTQQLKSRYLGAWYK